MTKLRPSLANSIGIVFASLFLCLFGALPAFATDGIYTKFGLDLGYAGRIGFTGPEWAIYVYGAGTSTSSRFNAFDISGSSSVEGNVALAGVNSTMTMSGSSSVVGDIYRQTTATVSRTGSATITGTQHTANSDLNSGVNSLKNVSVMAAGLTRTTGSPTSINLGNANNLTISNNPFAGKYVMNLSNFVMGGASTLTLNGAAGSAFVLNISGNFSIGGASQVKLTGGLTVSDVLFNVTGSNSTFSIGGGSNFNGTLLAYNSNPNGAQRTLTITGNNTVVNGEVIVNRLVLSGSAKVKKPKEKSKHKDDDDDDIAPSSPLH